MIVALLAACGGAQAPAAAPAAPVVDGDPTCPLELPGTSVAVEDTPDGAALVFVTTGSVDEIRVRARALSDAHDQRGSVRGGLAAMFTTPSTTAMTPIPGGARVAFTPAKPDDLAALQRELHSHGEHLGGNSCRMAM